jgi:cytochrome c oxidase subunit IV
MTHVSPPSSDYPSHTTEAIVHEHHPVRTYFFIFLALMVLLIVTVLASYLPAPEPWSFLIALAIAVIKATLVILFFMHVKDASRVTWLFCACSFLWLVILLALTFSDYMTRVKVHGATADAQAEKSPAAQVVKHEH